ncbi:1-deoxy-D-xylulose-5-phosphate synthase [Heliorestis acidaminivorans]|uniref:1-deoxy-D-xylulose-5-phosphate synthase n=1 Tax=Heliorestis acidaminivorans TaxID=553427 RepID=A0A6I0EYG0_9FIRM|nr:1-deoxy-D-xylulose-5-phosphate synthase [Heliorestis acidaminivorans]KAB2951685.1 1-deoxy-D-xylulose-5-phosphate synthase [Heliorestis acidaminivorans]
MAQVLSKIKEPQDLQQLSEAELEQICQEVRDVLIQTIATNGGHLAPNLGIVELTLALHLVFRTPDDKIVWDVGHQSYVHKLLTGRQEEFKTLRTYQGLAGFPKRSESPHDCINTGHSSTSISAALGLAFARDLKRKDNAVVAVIGDGALTGGMALEALNHAGNESTDLIVVLNDNEKSIADNVGAISTYLTRMRTDPRYFRNKEEMEDMVKKIPSIGPQVFKILEKVKEGVKHLMVPGVLFEELGYSYLGPIDGHNLTELRNVLNNARQLKGPVLVHVLTKKGCGYGPAEQNPGLFHGVGPFDVKTGKVHKTEGPKTYTQIFSDTMMQLARQDERVLGITAAMPDGTGLAPFARAFPARFYDVGIAEQHAVCMASALALEGLKPVVAIYSSFLQRAYDQIFHDVCLQKAPVVFAIDRAGLVGEDGETHHGVYDISYLRHIPGLTVMSPKDENELQHMLYSAYKLNSPVAIRYPRGQGLGVPLDQVLQELPYGQGEVLQEGQDLLIIAIGTMVQPAVEAAQLLAGKGIEVTVINGRYIKPLDSDLILSKARSISHVLTVEENVLDGGFGSAVQELLQDQQVECKVRRIGIPDSYVQHGALSMLKKDLGLTAENIAAVAEGFIGKQSQPPRRGNLKIAPIMSNVKLAFRGEK